MICWYPDYCHDNAFERLHSKEFPGSPDADGAGGCRSSFPFRLRRRRERGRREIRDTSETLVRPDIGIGGHIKRVAPALR